MHESNGCEVVRCRPVSWSTTALGQRPPQSLSTVEAVQRLNPPRGNPLKTLWRVCAAYPTRWGKLTMLTASFPGTEIPIKMTHSWIHGLKIRNKMPRGVIEGLFGKLPLIIPSPRCGKTESFADHLMVWGSCTSISGEKNLKISQDHESSTSH